MKTYEKMEKKLKLPKSERSAVSVAEFMAKYKIPSYYTALAWMKKKAASKGLKLKTAQVRKGTRGPPATVFWTVKGGKVAKETKPKRKYTRRKGHEVFSMPIAGKIGPADTAVVADASGNTLATVVLSPPPIVEVEPGSINATPGEPIPESVLSIGTIKPIDGPSFLRRYMALTADEREALNPPAPDVAAVGSEVEAVPEGPASAAAIDYADHPDSFGGTDFPDVGTGPDAGVSGGDQ